MGIFVVTQSVDENDELLAFFLDWLKLLAEKTEKIIVVANRVGKYHLPSNVVVYSLAESTKASSAQKALRIQALFLRHRNEYEKVFFHMCPEYALALHVLPRLFRKRSVLWYVHKRVSVRLRIAHALVHVIMTATEQSCGIHSRKVRVCGHGINTELFRPAPTLPNSTLQIIAVGRISAVKKYEHLITILKKLRDTGTPFSMRFVGPVFPGKDQIYFSSLQEQIRTEQLSEHVTFTGPILRTQLPAVYHSAHVLINLTATGSLDKVVLEALSTGLHVLCPNESLKDQLPHIYIPITDLDSYMTRLQHLTPDIQRENRQYITARHNLQHLINFLASV